MHGDFMRTKMMMRPHMKERGSKFHLEPYEKENYITGEFFAAPPKGAVY